MAKKNFGKLITILLAIQLVTIGQVVGQSYEFGFSQNENGTFYTDTTVVYEQKTIPNQLLIEYLSPKFQKNDVPIQKKDSSTSYIINYVYTSFKNTLWYKCKLAIKKDSIGLTFFGFEIQDLGEYNTPNPQKITLENLFQKYLKNKQKSSLFAYENEFEEIEYLIFAEKKKLIGIIKKPSH